MYLANFKSMPAWYWRVCLLAELFLPALASADDLARAKSNNGCAYLGAAYSRTPHGKANGEGCMKMGWKLAAPVLVLAFVLGSWPATAQPRGGECEGKLHRDSSGLLIGGGRGEDEGICLIDAADAKKVLAVCTLEHHCRISGHIGNCGDVGECGKISGITSVHRR
jgi:hypothetical protein